MEAAITYTIIPDIHGQFAKLDALLTKLGWRKERSLWRRPANDDHLVFLGDFIDRGPENRRVLETVRDLVDSGFASAIMGNHELNAIHFHTDEPETGQPLRKHSEKNINQHKDFLAEFPTGDPNTMSAISWFKTLPLWISFDRFRVVHACWSSEAIGSLVAEGAGPVLKDAQVIEAGRKGTPIYKAVDVLTKGPELLLPDGLAFEDKGEHLRHHVRLAWWLSEADTWRTAAISVPDPSKLPDTPIPENAAVKYRYPELEKPVFFGHYWLTGTPTIESENALCLDYSAGKDGPLVAYRFEDGDEQLTSDRFVVSHCQ